MLFPNCTALQELFLISRPCRNLIFPHSRALELCPNCTATHKAILFTMIICCFLDLTDFSPSSRVQNGITRTDRERVVITRTVTEIKCIISLWICVNTFNFPLLKALLQLRTKYLIRY
jgi:hypothetical protein